ncbi:unnamed protein product, partial [Polarella glacialis]
CFYFAAFHEAKKYAPKGPVSTSQKVLSDLGAGFIAGCAAATANNPFDVVKTRQQVRAAGAVSSHAVAQEFAALQSSSCLGVAADMIRKDGLGSLYKGYVAKVARLGPGSAIIFCIYEQVMGLF